MTYELANDNRSPNAHLIEQHPRMSHLPDLGIALSPEADAKFRARAEEYAIDYDKLKRDLALSHQVILEQPYQLALKLTAQNIIAVNRLEEFMQDCLFGMIFFEKRRRRLERSTALN